MQQGVIKRFTDKEPRFWTFQIFGWLVYLAIDYRINITVLNDLTDHLMWLPGVLIVFLLSLSCRYLYQYCYKLNMNIIKIATIIVLCSIAGGLLWYYSRGLLYSTVFTSKFENFAQYNYRFGGVLWINYIARPVYTLFGWSTIYFGVKSWKDFNDEKERINKVNLLAQESKLRMLRYQINPHFLFNSLNSIQALMNHDTKVADKMLTQLSDFLRYSLIADDRIYVPLKREIEIIEKYISIEKIRFTKKLEYQIEVSNDVLEVEILCFLLQPLVENAIKHGFKSNPQKLNVIVSACQKDSTLIITIKNTGKWIINGGKPGTGIENVKERLENAYPGSHDFNITEEDGWVILTLEIKITDEEI